MFLKVVCLSAFALCCMNANAASVEKIPNQDSSEEKQTKETLESLKEFVRIVDKHNLNVSIIGSHKKYASGGWMWKESVSLIMQMPHNGEFLTEATLDDSKQDAYLKKLDTIGRKEHVGAKTRVIQIKDGIDHLTDEQSVNNQYFIGSSSYTYLTTYLKGVQGFTVPENETSHTLYNYIIKKPSTNGVKNVQIITANVILKELDVSKDFPAGVLHEIKQVLPKLWLSIDDETILARLLVNNLDKKFEGNFQALIGVDNFALGGKQYANIEIGNTNVLVFSLA